MTTRIVHGEREYDFVVDEFLKSPQLLDLFLRREFYDLHSKRATPSHYFQLIGTQNRLPIATFYCGKLETGFRSPIRGSYGGFAFDADVPLDLRENFVRSVESRLRELGAQSLSITAAPDAYDPAEAAKSFHTLFANKFSISAQELNYSIPISEKPFEEIIDYGNRKRLKKLEREGFTARILEASEFKMAYDVIVENRKRRGFPVTMAWEDLAQMETTIPGVLVCHGIFSGTTCVAASVCVVVNPKVLYVFYWGDGAGMESFSPITLLAKEIYQYSRTNKYQVLDLGISTVKGIPNLGLIRFKRNLGAVESLKLSWEKVF